MNGFNPYSSIRGIGRRQDHTEGSPARPIPIAQTRELLPVPLGPMTRFKRAPGFDFKYVYVMKL